MKIFSKNLITYLIYWISLIVFYVIPCFFEIISIEIGTILFFVSFILLIILIGYRFSFKEFIWGIGAMEIQLVLSTLFLIFGVSDNEEIPGIVAYGNIMSSAFIANDVLKCIISILLPVACIMIGFGIKKLLKNKVHRDKLK